MGLDTPERTTPQDRLLALVADDMARVTDTIATRMASEHAPRIPQVTAHLIEAGGNLPLYRSADETTTFVESESDRFEQLAGQQ